MSRERQRRGAAAPGAGGVSTAAKGGQKRREGSAEQQLEGTKRTKTHQEGSIQSGGRKRPPGRPELSTTQGAERPKLPAERNVLLGSWRVESGSQGGGVTGLGQGKGTDRNAMARELSTAFSNPCVLMFGNGITFAPSTYSIQALDGSVFRGSVDYRSTQKQVISAITQESWKTLSFEIEGPNRIVWGALRLRTSAGRCAWGHCSGERGDCAEQRAHVGGWPTGRRSAMIEYGVVRNAATSALEVLPPPHEPPATGSGDRQFVCCRVSGSAAPQPILSRVCCRAEVRPGEAARHLQAHRVAPAGLAETRRVDIAARVNSCEAGGIRYGADDKPVFVR